MSYFALNTNVENQPLMLSNSTTMNDSLEYAVGIDTTIYENTPRKWNKYPDNIIKKK